MPFQWEAPMFRPIYEKGIFAWMENISSLKELIASSGFSVEFMELETSRNPPTEGRLAHNTCLLVFLTVITVI